LKNNQLLLGNARSSITLDVYGHLHPSMQDEAEHLIDELVTPAPLQLPKTIPVK
jgi:hypothetical protein